MLLEDNIQRAMCHVGPQWHLHSCCITFSNLAILIYLSSLFFILIHHVVPLKCLNSIFNTRLRDSEAYSLEFHASLKVIISYLRQRIFQHGQEQPSRCTQQKWLQTQPLTYTEQEITQPHRNSQRAITITIKTYKLKLESTSFLSLNHTPSKKSLTAMHSNWAQMVLTLAGNHLNPQQSQNHFLSN